MAPSIERQWFWLGAQEQTLPVDPRSWVRYDEAIERQLNTRWEAMQAEGREEGLVLDLAHLTKKPYQVWRGTPVKVANASASTSGLAPGVELGGVAIAGYPEALWKLPAEQCPMQAQTGQITAGFYQVFEDHAALLPKLQRHIADPSGSQWPYGENPRRRVVLAVEVSDSARAMPTVMRPGARELHHIQHLLSGTSWRHGHASSELAGASAAQKSISLPETRASRPGVEKMDGPCPHCGRRRMFVLFGHEARCARRRARRASTQGVI